jgi:hypothetical protein
MRKYPVIALCLLAPACASRNYTHYLVAQPPEKHPAFKEESGTLLRPFAFGNTTMMKVRWNDGNILTEVELPVLTAGQRVVIEHGGTPEGVKTLPATRLVPPPPGKGDQALIEAYRARGLRVNDSAAEVSIGRAKTLLQAALREGNYQLALEWCETVLERYPSHPEFLRSKASILLLMGERAKAIEVYEQAEEVESDPAVRKKLEELERTKE